MKQEKEFDYTEFEKRAEVMFVQAHHLPNMAYLVDGVVERIQEETAGRLRYPWEVPSREALAVVALEVGDDWGEWITGGLVKDAVKVRRKEIKAWKGLYLGENLQNEILKVVVGEWQSGKISDVGIIAETGLGFSHHWVASNSERLDELNYILEQKYYFLDLFGELPDDLSAKKILKMARRGELPGVAKGLIGHRELGARFIIESGRNPGGVIAFGREIDDVCRSAGGENETGRHCVLGSRNIATDRNTTTFSLLLERRLKSPMLVYESERGVEQVSMFLEDMWRMFDERGWL